MEPAPRSPLAHRVIIARVSYVHNPTRGPSRPAVLSQVSTQTGGKEQTAPEMEDKEAVAFCFPGDFAEILR